MSRHKGKSQRRIKDWRQKYLHGEKGDAHASARESLSHRAVKLPPFRLDEAKQNLDDLPRIEGMITGLFPGGAVVRPQQRDGDDELLCGVAKAFRPPSGSEHLSPLAVGDEVTVAAASQAPGPVAERDRDRADGMIIARKPRRTVLARPVPKAGRRRERYTPPPVQKVVAANMDTLLIVSSTRRPKFRPGLVDRFLIIAERGDMSPLLVVNKTDLADPDEEHLAEFRAVDLPIYLTSAVKKNGIDELSAALAGRRSILAGASGVGKSELVNALVPGAGAKTRKVRMKDRRGRHTTAAASVYDLPWDKGAQEGGILVDTPGIRELAIDLTGEELPWYFPEFQAVAQNCKFNDCTHTHEPNCAVKDAVEKGIIPAGRYNRYLRILETIPH